MMNSVTSSTTQVTKCTHFDEANIKDTSTSNKRQSSKAIVIDFIKAKTRLLQPTIASILLKLGTHYLDLHMKAHHKAVQKKRMMDDDEFIPHSAHIEFTLMVSKEAKEDQEFQDLAEATNKIISDCRKSLKA
jgi:ribosome-binding ATPase YchF (GTP1/OBG family)